MGIKRNFAFNSILTISNYIFPFLVYPYVSRVLGAENIGICNFVDSIINYAIMFATLGITVVGNREVARSRSDKSQISSTFTALILITGVTTLLSSIVLVTLTYTLDAFIPYRPLLLIGLLKLWGTFLLIEWFYSGLEKFRYITIRSIIVKSLYVVCIFLFVRNADDYPVYYLLMCLLVAVNAAVNCFNALRFVRLRTNRAAVVQVIKPFLLFGLYMFCGSLYITFNVSYLGFACGDAQVGYYTTATKVMQIILAIYTAYTNVAFPRASSLLAGGKNEEYQTLIFKSINGLLLFAVPSSVFCCLYASGIVDVISGAQFAASVTPLRIISFLVLIIGSEQLFIFQVLAPMGYDRIMLRNSCVGAFVGVVGNILIVGHLGSVGSAIVWLCAETAILILTLIFLKRRANINMQFSLIIKTLCAYIPFAIISVAFIRLSGFSPIAEMATGLVFLGVYIVLMHKYVLTNPVYDQLSGQILSKLKMR